MLKPVFTLSLDTDILPRRVAVGKFDGMHPCLVAATAAGDKVVVHNPHGRAAAQAATDQQQQQSDNPGKSYAGQNRASSDVELLNINQSINALACGPLRPGDPSEALVIGTPTSLLVYDVQNNRDFFYRDIPDGTNAVAVGLIGQFQEPLAVSGGNCALQGFNSKGVDVYWTVTGDNITALAIADLDMDGQNELLVGSEDNDIRVFKGDTILYELSEMDSIAFLCPLGQETFAYALNNGTLGVYHRRERLWRIKSKNKAISMIALDINGDGVPEIITGWSNGKVDGRLVETGEVVFKDSFKESIAGIVMADYNLDGIPEVIVVNVKGDVRGYVPAGNKMAGAASGSQQAQHPLSLPPGVQPVVARESDAVAEAEQLEQDAIREMMKRRTNLAAELKNYEENNRVVASAGGSFRGMATGEEDSFGAIPADTQLKSALVISALDGGGADFANATVILTLETNNDTIIRAAVIFAEGIFDGESCVYHPSETELGSEGTSGVQIPLKPLKDVPVDLHIKALVGYRNSYHYHIFELTRHLPKFAMYANTIHATEKQDGQTDGLGKVTFTLLGRVQNVVAWFTNNFLLVRDLAGMIALGKLNLNFIHLRDGTRLELHWDIAAGEFEIHTGSMDLAGELVQSLVADTLRLEDLSSTAEFPAEMDRLKEWCTKVEDLQSVRDQLAADIADNSSLIKSLVVRAEDARLLKEFEKMKSLYMELNQLNGELINEYQIRARNHQDLVEALKQVNMTIQRAGNLRVGESKTKLIQACRTAIKANNFNSLTRIITSGEF